MFVQVKRVVYQVDGEDEVVLHRGDRVPESIPESALDSLLATDAVGEDDPTVEPEPEVAPVEDDSPTPPAELLDFAIDSYLDTDPDDPQSPSDPDPFNEE